MNKVVVVGGGAAGMMAAVTAAKEGAEVILLERNDRTGKKLLATGNGRCNFTNTVQEPFCYRSDQTGFAWQVIERFHVQDAVSFFLRMGVYSKNRNGYLYPNSDQASAVADAFGMEMDRLGVKVQTETICVEIIPERTYDGSGSSDGFRVVTNCGEIHADKVILCAGSKAAPSTGSDGSGYQIAQQLGHRIVPVLPALVQLRCKEKHVRKLAGVRTAGKVSLWCGEECIAEDTGELQITDYGISGIPVFQVSRYAARALYEGREVKAVLDFMPDFSIEGFHTFLKARCASRPDKKAEDFFVGLFHKKLSDLWIRLSKIPRTKRAGDLTEEEIQYLVWLVKEFRLTVTQTNSFEQAQVCCGGVDTRQIDPETMESVLVPGLYFAGEMVDVDGMCGGYNLQWAWSSGHVAGKEAANA